MFMQNAKKESYLAFCNVRQVVYVDLCLGGL